MAILADSVQWHVNRYRAAVNIQTIKLNHGDQSEALGRPRAC